MIGDGMQSWLAAVLLGAVAVGAQAVEKPAVRDDLSAGRRMVHVPVQGKVLSGRAPQGQGAPFRVLNGSEVVWEGGADEQFEVKVPQGTGHLYLFSANARNLGWQELGWSGAHKPSPRPKAAKKELAVEDVAKGGVLPGGKDAGPALRRLLSKVRSREYAGKGVCIQFPKGEYHFYPEGALQMSYYISNHDQQEVCPVAVPLVGLEHVTLDGQGSTFVFHGIMQPILIMDSSHLQLRNVSLRYEYPYDVEGTITEIREGKTTLKIDPAFHWKVQNGRFRILREGSESPVRVALAFEKNGAMVPMNGGGDLGWPDVAEQVGKHTVRFAADAAKYGLKPGHILVLRDYSRPYPAMVLYRADHTTLDNVVFHETQGMALLAQRSEHVTIRGGGCVALKGRVHTASADATHFSNCRGRIKVQGALYEGMMDDAINVHSTCLAIDQVNSPTQITVRYVHRQAVGFEVFRPGERVQFIKGATLENHPDIGKAVAVEKLDETHLRLTLDKPLPEGIGKGDAVENADWYPSVVFRNNTVRYNRARGCLFTTPQSVLVEANKFVRSHGSAILLAGDAQGWYESGRCQDVVIRRNLFDHNLTAKYQFTEAIISIYPEVRNLAHQQEPYHRNILIEDNEFRTHRVPLLFAQSADEITWKKNKVIYDNQFPARAAGKPFIFRGPEPKHSVFPSTN